MLLSQKVIDELQKCCDLAIGYDGPTLSIDIFFHDDKKETIIIETVKGTKNKNDIDKDVEIFKKDGKEDFKSFVSVNDGKDSEAWNKFHTSIFKKKFRKLGNFKNWVDGKLIKKFNSIKEASTFYNITDSAIIQNLKGKTKTCLNSYWRYL